MASRKLDRTELARKDLIDKIRTVKRLEHRIALRHELNDVESAVLDEFDRRVAEGQPHELTYNDVRALVGRKRADGHDAGDLDNRNLAFAKDDS